MVRSLQRSPAVVLQNNEEMLLDSKNPLHRSDSSNMTYANDDSEAEYLSRIEEDTALYSSNNSASQRGALVTGVMVQQQDDCEIIAEKKVRFSQIDFRVFYMSLGDNPVSGTETRRRGSLDSHHRFAKLTVVFFGYRDARMDHRYVQGNHIRRNSNSKTRSVLVTH